MLKRKIAAVVLMVLMLTQMVSVGFAAAITTDQMAVVLNDISLLAGDENGYNLDGKLKRSEAATFTVKLLGMEKEVLNNKQKYIVDVFPDVKPDDWFAPYVGYCYKNGIISGYPDGTFKPNEYVSEKAFAQMTLGVMGYNSGKDFNWDTVLKFAYEKNLVDNIAYTVSTEDNLDFYRRDAVAIMYNSLTEPIDGADITVIENLVNKGVTTMTKAKKHGLLKTDEDATEIEKVSLINETTIKVTFNENVDVGKSDVEITADGKDISVDNIFISGKYVTVETDEPMYEGKSYEVAFDKVTDKDGFMTFGLSKNFSGYVKPALESNYFEISKIVPVASNVIEVYFTHPIDDSAEQVLLYKFKRNGSDYFEGSFKNLDVKPIPGADNGVVLISYGYSFDSNSDYELQVRGDLVSAYGVNLDDGNGDSMTFTGTNNQLDDFEIVQMYSYDKDYILVEFSHGVDEESALKRDNYILTDESNGRTYKPSAVYISQLDEHEAHTAVMLKFTGLRNDREYTLSVNGVYDLYEQSYINKYKADIGYVETVANDIELVNIEQVNKNLLVLTFSAPLDVASERAYMYVNNGGKIVDKKLNPENPYQMLLYFGKSSNIGRDADYTITIKNGLKDFMGREQKSVIGDTFYGANINREYIYVEKAAYISEDKVLVKFSDDVRESDLNDINKYEFIYKSGKVERTVFPSELTVIDDRTVVLTLGSKYEEGNMTLVVDSIYDYTGQYRYTDLRYDVE